MGWFWAEQPPRQTKAAPHAIPPSSSGAAPPPGCPMHTSDTPTPTPITPAPFPPLANTSQADQPPSSCPIKSPDQPLPSSTASSTQPPANSSTLQKLNPLNYMPTLSNTRESTSPQSISLPLSREPSTIPRSDLPNQNWEYPSPQQMYNAMLRKGYTDTPAEHVESMVAVHNFLNEGAWAEIETWESLFSRSWSEAWGVCRHGEQGIAESRARQEFLKERRRTLGLALTPEQQQQEERRPKLIRFQGRPKEPTPKARILTLLGKVFPEHFTNEPPFDRHDWYISRPVATTTSPTSPTSPTSTAPEPETREIRYVIDYYSGGLEEGSGAPVFYLDIRPALDSPSAVAERVMRWGGDVWWRASGGVAREAFRREREREVGGRGGGS